MGNNLKIGILWNSPSEFDLDVNFIDYIGENSGNLAFLTAVKTAFGSNLPHVPWHSDPLEIKNKFDFLILPAANQLGAHTDLGGICELWKQYDIPILVIGLGIQTSHGSSPVLKNGTQKWLDFLLDNASKHSLPIFLRGDETKSFILKNNPNVSNLYDIGCPSQFLINSDLLTGVIKNKQQKVFNNVAIGNADISWDFALQSEIRLLQTFAQSSLIVQAPTELFNFIGGADQSRDSNFFNSIYGKRFHDNFHDYVDGSLESYDIFIKKFLVFKSYESWISSLRNFDAAIGFRIHNSILSLISGTPSLTLTVDARTQELCNTLGLPYISCQNEAAMEPSLIVEYLKAHDFNCTKNKIASNYAIFNTQISKIGLSLSDQIKANWPG